MEYLVVHYTTSRRVKVDGEFNGVTEVLIELEAGTHTVTLEPPPNFDPGEQTIVLQDTSALSPCEVTFAPKG
jgi:hypothetical protein